jgi:hypothetical protein
LETAESKAPASKGSASASASKLDPWMEAHGERDHLWRQSADNFGLPSRSAGDGARARRHVEDAAARAPAASRSVDAPRVTGSKSW